MSDLLARSDLAKRAGLQFGGDRDIDANLGYKVSPTIDDFKGYYDRKGLASVIVDAPAKTTWRKTPKVLDSGGEEGPFAKAWEELAKRLKIFHFLERADRLSGIGRYGIILIGTKEGNLDSEIGTASGDSLLFLQPYSEKYATVKEFETKTAEPRFGQPLSYNVDTAGDLDFGKTASQKSVVHWSRVIHVAEGLLDNEVYGEPRLQKVFDYLFDVSKVVGASAESFWQNAIKGYALTAQEGYEIDPDAEEAAKDAWQGYIHNLQRIIAMDGIDFKELGANPSDPASVFKVIIQLISGKTGIPQRILLGSERGDLASSQDEANWLGRVSERQEQFAEPMILRRLIDRFVDIGALKAPVNGEYDVQWPKLFYLTDLEIAEIYQKRAEAMFKASAGHPLDMFSEAEVRVALGFSAERDETQLVVQSLNEENPEIQRQFAKIRREHVSNG